MSLRLIPVLSIPLVMYIFIAITSGAHTAQTLAGAVFSMHLASGDQWVMSLGGLLTLIALVCLFVELIRSSRASRAAILGNMAAAGLLIICIGLFLLARGFGTTEFFLLTFLFLLDFLADSTIMIFTSRRTVEYEHA